MTMNFLFQSPHAWRGVWQRPHHLAREFARAGHAVRYVQPRYLKWLIEDRARFFQSRSERVDAKIDIRSVTLVNGERFEAVRSRNLRALAKELSLPKSDVPRVLWLYNPHEAALTDLVPHEILVYDIMDEYRGFPWSPPNIEKEEAALLARANHVFAGTGALFDAKRTQAEGKIECVLSGVDAKHFARLNQAVAPPPEIAAIKSKFQKIIGYAGVIDLRVDQDLVIELARQYPEWCWIFLGPMRCDASQLRAEPNIQLLGEKHYEDLPGYYHSFDCAVIPFVENEVTRHINPTKMLEYAAAGLPILSRALPDAKRFYADGAWLYHTQGEARKMLEAILNSSNAGIEELGSKKLARAAEWSRERSWSALAAQMIERLKRT